ncbi:pilin [Candidatus Saccharibacteria bacterium]|nr:pilin [Candidatus Saccharibacteria bacterium]
MNKIKLITLSLLAPLTILGAAQPALGFNVFCTTNSSGKCVSGPCKDHPNAPTCQGGTEDPVTGPGNIFSVAASIVALLTGLAAIIMIIVSGLTMITSAGNSEAVTTARRRLVAAVIGLVIVLLAWAIIRFVIDNVIA